MSRLCSSSKRSLHFAMLSAAVVALGCATSSAPQRESVVVEEGGGFVVSHPGRVSSDVQADFQSAVSLLRAERTQEGIARLVEVTQAEPSSVAAHLDLGIAYQRVGDLERAEASIAAALALSPEHPVALNELGMIQRKTGRLREARQSYEQALARHPTFRFARLNLAILCDLYLADRNCALEHYELYAQAAPDDERVGMWIADLRARAGKE